ncbi:MAG: mono/diheme cytochrome c family protein [Saprospiraceae bacterium]|jgi:mono/diheme cytochrome c family protein
MIKIYSISAISLLFGMGLFWSGNSNALDNKSVVELLESKGVDYSEKKPNFDLAGVSAEAGEQLFHYGFAQKPNGGKSPRQSKHFVCTSCHNVEKEDPDLSVSDPQARLIYTNERGFPFLQGTTMYGAVNRSTYYNGDYEKKYGDLVEPARTDIRGAIQLCATECAQGRELKDWELESILAYLWTLELKIEDLGLTEETASKLDVESIQAKYLQGSPATFLPPPSDRKGGSGLIGRPDNGKLIYENSCLHCHYRGEYSFLHLDNSRLSFKHLKRNISKYSRHSLYQVTRWGVPVKSGKRSYMPQYTEERMSQQQLADLRAFIEEEAS